MSRLLLQNACKQIGLALNAQQIDCIEQYIQLLQKWNKIYNLTAIRNPQAMLKQHILDCLAVVPPLMQQIEKYTIHTQRILDVGSGGGLPGVLLAICLSDWQIDCVDTVGKKAAFIQQVAASLGLKNLRGIHARVENLAQNQTEPYGVICARAFASLSDFVTGSQAVLHPNGLFMALKGKYPEDEIAQLPQSVAVLDVETVEVPNLDAERCVVWMRNQN